MLGFAARRAPLVVLHFPAAANMFAGKRSTLDVIHKTKKFRANGGVMTQLKEVLRNNMPPNALHFLLLMRSFNFWGEASKAPSKQETGATLR